MVMTQMNVRIDAALKHDVDDVLAEQGVSASDVVREIWSYIADRHELPSLETDQQERSRMAWIERRRRVIDEGAGMIHRELMAAGVIGEHTDLVGERTYRQLRDAMNSQRLDSYLALRRAD